MFIGADPVSTWVAKQNRAYRGLVPLVKKARKLVIANDDNYALAA